MKESVVQKRESTSPVRTFENGRRIRQIRTSSPILNYNKRFDERGVDRGPVIDGYQTKVEDFEEPFQDTNTVYQQLDEYLYQQRHSNHKEGESVIGYTQQDQNDRFGFVADGGSYLESPVLRNGMDTGIRSFEQMTKRVLEHSRLSN